MRDQDYDLRAGTTISLFPIFTSGNMGTTSGFDLDSVDGIHFRKNGTTNMLEYSIDDKNWSTL